MHHRMMVAGQFFRADEVYRGVVLVKIMRHGDDGIAHGVPICSLFKHDEAFRPMLLSGGEYRTITTAQLVDGFLNGARILNAAGNASYATDRVRMSLAQAVSPEGVGLAIGQQGLAH